MLIGTKSLSAAYGGVGQSLQVVAEEFGVHHQAVCLVFELSDDFVQSRLVEPHGEVSLDSLYIFDHFFGVRTDTLTKFRELGANHYRTKNGTRRIYDFFFESLSEHNGMR